MPVRQFVTGASHGALLEAPTGRDSPALVEIYASLRPGGADASVIALAERLNVATIATLNRRDFTAVRPRHVQALTLLPE
jgi:hypothetical protein